MADVQSKPAAASAISKVQEDEDRPAKAHFPLAYEPSRHEREITNYFQKYGVRDDASVQVEPVPALFICFTNRCGSNYLAELLASTGKVPRAGESFNWPQVVKVSKKNGFTSLRQFSQFLIKKRSTNGLFAGKVSWSQLYFLARTGLIPNVFAPPSFIHVRRLDLLGQAISYVIATQTGQWKSNHVSKQGGRAANSEPIYKAEAIAARMKSIAAANARFKEFFACFGFPMIEVVYEDFIRDKARIVNSITEWLGLGPSTIDDEKTKLEAQRSSLNDEWRARFMSERMVHFSEGDR